MVILSYTKRSYFDLYQTAPTTGLIQQGIQAGEISAQNPIHFGLTASSKPLHYPVAQTFHLRRTQTVCHRIAVKFDLIPLRLDQVLAAFRHGK